MLHFLLVAPALVSAWSVPSPAARGVCSHHARAAVRCPTSPLMATGPEQSPTYYQDKLCAEDECELANEDEFCVAVLGDLHIDPRKMEDYAEGHGHIVPILEDAKTRGVNAALVSLGDLGESK